MEPVINRIIDDMVSNNERSMLERMANDYFDLTWMEMNHHFNYVDHLVWVYDRIIEERPDQFEIPIIRNNVNTYKFLKCLTAVLIQQDEEAKKLFKTTVVDSRFRPLEETPAYYADFIEDRIEDFRCGHGKTSTLLEMIQYIADTAIMRDPAMLIKNNSRRSTYNRLHYRNYQADSIFPKWVESIVQQAKSGDRKSHLYQDVVLSRASEFNIFLDVDKETRSKFLYDLAASVVCELSDKFTDEEISVQLSMLRPGFFSLEKDEEDVAGILGDLENMDENDRLLATYKFFGYFLYHTPHSEQILELMVAECQLEQKEGWSIG